MRPRKSDIITKSPFVIGFGHSAATGRLALPVPDLDPAPNRPGPAPNPPAFLAFFFDAASTVGGACGVRRGGRPSVGRPSHRRHFADTQRSTWSAYRHRTIRPGEEPAVPGQYSAVVRFRAERTPSLACPAHRRIARVRVSRDREMGRIAAAVTNGRSLSPLLDARAPMDSEAWRRSFSRVDRLAGVLVARDSLQRARDVGRDRGRLCAPCCERITPRP